MADFVGESENVKWQLGEDGLYGVGGRRVLSADWWKSVRSGSRPSVCLNVGLWMAVLSAVENESWGERWIDLNRLLGCCSLVWNS